MSNNYQEWAAMRVDTQASTPRDLKITTIRAIERHYQDVLKVVKTMKFNGSNDSTKVQEDVLAFVQGRLDKCNRTIARLQSNGGS